MIQTAAMSEPAPVSHNVMGQRLGRKGFETRERILAGFERLLHGAADRPITLSGVAREAGVGMSTFYLYFPDLGALVLAGLQRIMAGGPIAFVETLRVRWPDEDLRRACLEFVRQYHRFWRENGRILHLRNMLADANDERFLDTRHRTTLPMIRMLAQQMDGDPRDGAAFATRFAMVLLTSVERICTVVTNPYFPFRDGRGADSVPDHVDGLIEAEARLLEVAIRHQRQARAAPA